MQILQKITNESEHAVAMSRIDELWEADLGTPEGNELDALVKLVAAYEKETVDWGEPDPYTAIEFRLDQQGMTEDDLVPIIGNREKVAELLSGKRKITEEQAQALHDLLRVPMDVLLEIIETEGT